MSQANIEVLPYPETIQEDMAEQVKTEIFQPDQLHVVMGASGKAHNEVFVENMVTDGIPLYKRKGGGGTVLLGDHCVVLTVHAHVRQRYENLRYFRAINHVLIQKLHASTGHDYQQRGISDVACGGLKVVGTSIFRRRFYLLYQASILLESPIELIERYLKMPPKEPDYRQGRSHRQFVTSLKDLGLQQTAQKFMGELGKNLNDQLQLALEEADRHADI